MKHKRYQDANGVQGTLFHQSCWEMIELPVTTYCGGGRGQAGGLSSSSLGICGWAASCSGGRVKLLTWCPLLLTLIIIYKAQCGLLGLLWVPELPWVF